MCAQRVNPPGLVRLRNLRCTVTSAVALDPLSQCSLEIGLFFPRHPLESHRAILSQVFIAVIVSAWVFFIGLFLQGAA